MRAGGRGRASVELRAVLESAARLQELVPDAVLVGGSAAALYAAHRDSYDHDHVVRDLRDRFELVLEALESFGAALAGLEPGPRDKPGAGRCDARSRGVTRMPLAFRNLTTDPCEPVARWPVEAVIARARARAERREREAVAAEIRQAVERSGLTRAELASRLGTSASRLSTYLTGKVVPSATFMVRLRRVLEATD